MEDKPLFQHDCERCVFLGCYEKVVDVEVYDLYFCPSPSNQPTVIARYSDAGPDYMSGLEVALAVEQQGESEYPLVVALQRAREKDLCDR